ncbi:MAG TPA: hypothetical protein VFT86_01220, partial [Gaiellaceae bacterium]|nr:hypothetical protein [Gaiellaceae bacterium]
EELALGLGKRRPALRLAAPLLALLRALAALSRLALGLLLLLLGLGLLFGRSGRACAGRLAPVTSAA